MRLGQVSRDGDAELDRDQGRYRAFISYSHRDTAWCKRIHRSLEMYRIPKTLVGTKTALGTVPARMSPIFRDREELSIGNDLSELVRAALGESDALIVLCSPDAKASRWVNQEIETFRALYPERPIYAAIIEGDPELAFPPALLASEGGAREPVAADFREQGDGYKLAKLKLMSGLTGLGLDALVRRDAQRQRRRVIAVTLGAASIMLLLIALLVMAVRAQAEAERQRQGAEGLVEYMLTDLRDRLKGVGRLDVMTAVNERAMRYYANQGDLSGLPDASLDRRARILHAMGEDDQKRGDQSKALAKFTEAHRATAATLARRPHSPDAVLAHAQSEYWVGFAHQSADRNRMALAHYQAHFKLATRYAAMTTQSRRAIKELGWSHNTTGALYLLGLNEPEQAAAHFAQYIALFRALSKSDPGDKDAAYSLSDALAWAADAEIAMKRPQAAQKLRLEQRDVLARLSADDPDNSVYQLARVVAERELFRICYRAKDFGCAQVHIRSAVMLAQNGRAAGDGNLDWIRQVAQANLDLGFLNESQGMADAARQQLIIVRRYLVDNAVTLKKAPDISNDLQTTAAVLETRINE
jgi:tetratricopeptide (TPR) repeat protein